MALDQKTREADRVYEEFEPPSDWDHDEESDTLILMLPGFKKEQLRVQVTSTRVLRVSGERQISENKWRRFRREMPMPSHSDTTGIGAKFEAGMLYVRLPKVIKNKQHNGPTPTPTPTPTQEASPKPQQPTTRQSSKPQQPAPTQEAPPKPQQPTTRQSSKPQQPTPTQEAPPKPQQPTTRQSSKPQQPTTPQEAPKTDQQTITTDQKPNNGQKKQPRVLEDKPAEESQKPVQQEPKADEDYSDQKKEREKGKAGVVTDEDVNNKDAKERVEGAMAPKAEDQTGDGIGSDGLGKTREGKMEKRSLTMEMLARQSQEYMSALSRLAEEVKKEKKLVNVLLVIFFVLLLVLFVKNAIKSVFS